MSGLLPLTWYNLAVGLATVLGVAFVVRRDRTDVPYRRSIRTTVVGVLVLLVGGPVAELYVHSMVHWVHAGATLLVVAGFAGPVWNGLGELAWLDVVLDEPPARRPAARPLDVAILRLFEESDLVLSPSLVAYNLGNSRAEVNRRLVGLESRGLLTRVERGKYRLADREVAGPDDSIGGRAGVGSESTVEHAER